MGQADAAGRTLQVVRIPSPGRVLGADGLFAPASHMNFVIANQAVIVPTYNERRAAFAIACSSGTYVRSLVADLGDAYCLELRRTAIGPFEVGDAVAPPARGEPWSAPGLIELGRALELARAPGAR